MPSPQLRPGDEVLFHAGIHYTGLDTLRVAARGTAAHPIVFRGQQGATVDGEGGWAVFDLRDSAHLFFEGLSLRRAEYGIYADGTSWLVVRQCHLEDVRTGIYSYSENSTNWYIADNTLVGRNVTWYPRSRDSPSHTGINLYGRGHIVCHNRISGFWDGLAIANFGKPPHAPEMQPVAIDFYRNEISQAVDDGLEVDYGCHNIRVFENRIYNVHAGLSAQPTYGGPVYFVRNLVYNATALSLKLHNWCTGLEIYHNTLVSPRQGFHSYPRWQNTRLVQQPLFGGTTIRCRDWHAPPPELYGL